MVVACCFIFCIMRRLVRVILGPTAISEKKLLSGMPLDILGITVRIAPEGLHFFPTEDKVEKWKRTIASALQKGVLHGGEAQKLAGGLSWAGQKAFRRLGRAMLRPIIMQQWCIPLLHCACHARFSPRLLPGARQQRLGKNLGWPCSGSRRSSQKSWMKSGGGLESARHRCIYTATRAENLQG